MLNFVTMGQDHAHNISGRIIHKDNVAVFKSENREDGRDLAFEYFGPKFCFHYPETHWGAEDISYFKDGYVMLDGSMSHDEIVEYLENIKE